MIVSGTGYFTRNQLFGRRLLTYIYTLFFVKDLYILQLTFVVQLPNDITVVLSQKISYNKVNTVLQTQPYIYVSHTLYKFMK